MCPPASSLQPHQPPAHQSQNCLFSFSRCSVQYVISPLRILLIKSSSQSQHSRSFRIWALTYSYFCFDIITLSLLPVSYKCHVCSYIYHPSNVELALCHTTLASACQILPILQGPIETFLFCQEASLNSLISPFPKAPIAFYFFNFSSGIIQLHAVLSNVLNCPFSMSLHVHRVICSYGNLFGICFF